MNTQPIVCETCTYNTSIETCPNKSKTARLKNGALFYGNLTYCPCYSKKFGTPTSITNLPIDVENALQARMKRTGKGYAETIISILRSDLLRKR